ncbi:MAG: hypothetical protein HBSIN02_16980 [Bacteroidia bacterium]|nr:MAG: hypothetical protein HBSIN02_16980 [Bacteroidia bacterium]
MDPPSIVSSMIRLHSLVIVTMILSACSGRPLRTFSPDDPLQPDLYVKRVTYRALGPTQGTRTRATSLQIRYEFRIQVGNIGNAGFAEPFTISLTTQLNDYETHQYGKHVLVNEALAPIQPGQDQTFVLTADIEYPRPPFPAFLPMRIYLNTEGLQTTTALTIRKIPEHDYRNNVYELSLRTIQRL